MLENACKPREAAVSCAAALCERFEQRVSELNPNLAKVTYELRDLYGWLDNMVRLFIDQRARKQVFSTAQKSTPLRIRAAFTSARRSERAVNARERHATR